ncbi:P-loop containing nucleoside triphosphate hydrolase protein [Punctularia strigosozonata HHB-11173 SS5]|uniref:P-loop containing nucleoside triphosphate hydrolase protein n=1 Tax=Punctularia strigosozonata (strain HHB-11173) TaxID=741275 RepID=UPI000441872D|nr:P-loop containing nucleoside triphosphate hydrolase protein [Punctularia strigosozonata HHB-11173 SS5]EIN12944.1 P-loop containing nucleoside triphosphate hydrolase protein [Punctularia strigosozonata HHB-11173 SS5]
MKDEEPNTTTDNGALPVSRSYQREMLAESLHRNIVIAMDTGSGKTHIAVLRIKYESERESKKVSWFVAPTVALCEQQREVLATALPVSVGIISGSLEPDQWKDARIWQRVIETNRVIVSTPQVLLDAMRHGYVDMGQHINLLIFDEAHHAADKHPYNLIMKEFYFRLPPRGTGETPLSANSSINRERPMILGLTASPSFGGNLEKAFAIIEANLDSTIRAPRIFREELAAHVHRPTFKHVLYPLPTEDYGRPSSRNAQALNAVVASLDIGQDPYVISLRQQLQRALPGPERNRIDQKLSKTIQKKDSYSHKGLREFARAALDICYDLGPWPADWYVRKVIERAQASGESFNTTGMSSWHNRWRGTEKTYLLELLGRVNLDDPVDLDDEATLVNGCSEKVNLLISSLLSEKLAAEEDHELFTGLVFVTRRDSVLALAEILSRHPRTRGAFKVGCLLGSSDSVKRRAFLDITRELLVQSQTETLEDLKIGEKNLIISTAVAEEGIDIQACGAVFRWDPPPNMVSWAQSRGRARKKKSTFTLMFDDSGAHAKMVEQWERLEREMMNMYYDPSRDMREPEDGMGEHIGVDEVLEFKVPSTGALLTLQSAVTHLNHFCACIPGGQHAPIYDIDPPDLPEGWHATQTTFTPYQGPWGCVVILPRLLPRHLREFRVGREYTSKASARNHAAFFAYRSLYEAGLLNDHLLPITSVIEPELVEEIKQLLSDIEKRAGTATVSSQMDPWAPLPNAKGLWKMTCQVDGLPPLQLLTYSRPRLYSEDPPSNLYPGYRPPISMRFFEPERMDASAHEIDSARRFTRRLFWAIHHGRMAWNELNFAYIILPLPGIDPQWHARRSFGLEPDADDREVIRLNAAIAGEQFGYPNDLNLVVEESSKGRPTHWFMQWHFDQLSTVEEEAMRSRNPEKYSDMPIKYPLLLLKPGSRRHNMLIPRTLDEVPSSDAKPILLPADAATAILLSQAESEYALLLPSILRRLTVTMTAASLREMLFLSPRLRSIPLDLLTAAITAPVSGEIRNYQRLETLGDTALKFMASISLLTDYPLWHEGYLSKKKDHAVANVRLAKIALSKELYRWMIRDRFIVKKWRPKLAEWQKSSGDEKKMPESEVDTNAEKGRGQPQLSMKMLADIVEAIIGAAYLHGSFDLAVEVTRLFDIGIDIKTPPTCIERILVRAQASVDDLREIPSQIDVVERMLGYSFNNKVLLVEALTHASLQGTEGTISYERMEFLGDAVLDMVVTDYLYRRSDKNYGPGHMHLRKQAVVNMHFLAYVCFGISTELEAAMGSSDGVGNTSIRNSSQRVYLWQCLLHSSHRILDDQSNAFTRYQRNRKAFDRAFQHDTLFPWTALTQLQAPKALSDVVESTIGAVFLDSGGSFEVIQNLLRRYRILPTLERIVDCDVDVQHPVSRLSIWAAKEKKKVKYDFDKADGRISCAIYIDEQEEVRVTEPYRGRISQAEVKFMAAEQAIRKFRVISADSMLWEMEGVGHDNEGDEEESNDEEGRYDSGYDASVLDVF